MLATLVALLLGLAWSVVVRMAAGTDRLEDDSGMVAGATLVASLGLWFAFAAWTRQLVVTRTGIAVRRPFGADEIRMSELAGIRIRPLRRGRLIKFETRRGKQLMPLLAYATDRHYEDWIGGLPNLDKLERDASTLEWAPTRAWVRIRRSALHASRAGAGRRGGTKPAGFCY